MPKVEPIDTSCTILIKLQEEEKQALSTPDAVARPYSALREGLVKLWRATGGRGRVPALRRALKVAPGALRAHLSRVAKAAPGFWLEADNPYAWLRWEVQEPELAARLVERLRKAPGVEQVYRMPLLADPPGGSCGFPSLNQNWHASAPLGLGVRELVMPQRFGQGCRLADLESGWWLEDGRLPHCDLPQDLPITLDGDNRFDARAHGTRVLGLILALHQTPGVAIQGLAPQIDSLRLCGTHRDGLQDLPSALLRAALVLARGDVMLIEAQMFNGASLERVPIECDPLVFQQVLALTTLGVTVVAAAGNGGVDLDALQVSPDAGRRLDPTHADFRDSGAILVGAGERVEGRWLAKTTDRPSERGVAESNHGARVDCFAEGRLLPTLSVNTNEEGDAVAALAYMSDTSGAAALIAGAALIAQTLASEKPDTVPQGRLSPEELRWLFRNVGTPSEPRSEAPGRKRIGVMPDLARIRARLQREPLDAVTVPLEELQDPDLGLVWSAALECVVGPFASPQGASLSLHLEWILPPGTQITRSRPDDAAVPALTWTPGPGEERRGLGLLSLSPGAQARFVFDVRLPHAVSGAGPWSLSLVQSVGAAEVGCHARILTL